MIALQQLQNKCPLSLNIDNLVFISIYPFYGVLSLKSDFYTDLQIWFELLESLGIFAAEKIALGKTNEADETITKGLSLLGLFLEGFQMCFHSN